MKSREKTLDLFGNEDKFRTTDYWFQYYGEGYGGYSVEQIFDKLLSLEYSFKYIKEVLTKLFYLDSSNTDISFNSFLKEYQQSPIVEYESVNCLECGHRKNLIIRHFQRTGKYLNKKGKLLKVYNENS